MGKNVTKSVMKIYKQVGCVCSCVCTLMCVLMCAHVCTCTCVYMLMCMRVFICACACVYAHVCMHLCVLVCACCCMCVCIRAFHKPLSCAFLTRILRFTLTDSKPLWPSAVGYIFRPNPHNSFSTVFYPCTAPAASECLLVPLYSLAVRNSSFPSRSSPTVAWSVSQ